MSTDEIVATLRAVARLRREGLSVTVACAELGTTAQTYYRWRGLYDGLDEAQARRLAELLVENARLTRVLSERTLDVLALTDLVRHLQERASQRRASVSYLMSVFGMSERRACSLTGQHRSSHRYRGADGPEDLLVEAMLRQARAHPGFGYRRVHALLVADGWSVSARRVERLWRAHRVRPRTRSPPPPGGVSRPVGRRATSPDGGGALAPRVAGAHWACQVIGGRSATGLPRAAVLVVDEGSGAVLSVLVARTVTVPTVVAHLGATFVETPAPLSVAVDRPRRWLTRSVRDFLAGHHVRARVPPASAVVVARPGPGIAGAAESSHAVEVRRVLADPRNPTTEAATAALARGLGERRQALAPR